MSTEENEVQATEPEHTITTDGEGEGQVEETLGEYAVTDENAPVEWNINEEDSKDLRELTDDLYAFCQKKGLPLFIAVGLGNDGERENSMTASYSGIATDQGDRRHQFRSNLEFNAVAHQGLSGIINAQIPRILAQVMGGDGE